MAGGHLAPYVMEEPKESMQRNVLTLWVPVRLPIARIGLA
jgi:hypothetical protein